MLTYIQATQSDIPLLRALAHEIWTTSYTKMLSAEQIEYMLNWMYSEEGVQWELIRMGDETIGYIAVTPEEEKLKLNKLYLLRTIQGKGLGQQALAHVIDYARQSGYKSLYLTVNQRNYNAIKAYEKAGFVRTEFKIFDIGGGFVMDDFIYSMEL